MSETGGDACPSAWRGAGSSLRCELSDSAEAHAEPVLYTKGQRPHRHTASGPCHMQLTPNGYSTWGITIEDRARWAAYQAAGLV